MRHLYLTLLLCIYFISGNAQPAISPLDIPLYLSGNFGELRTNHFHSGIDFKTQGKIGLPVKAVKKGYISRIFVSPSGYGRALYVDHPDGTTTVYGHLDHFAREIETFTVDSQYIKQSFSIDMEISPDKFPVSQGQVIGYGGNTGSSGGPHLHFELRETATQNAHDPLVLYSSEIKDKVKPQIQSLMVYPEKGAGIVNGKSGKQIVSVKKNKGKEEYITPEIKVWGKIGFGLKTFDYMTDTQNTYGVKEIQLSIADSVIFKSYMGSFAFSETRYLNSFIDWEEWTYNQSFYIKSFIEPGNQLSIYQMKGNGIFDFNEEKEYQLKYTVKDLYDNTAVFTFNVTAEKQDIPAWQPAGILFPCNQNNSFEKDGISLQIPEGNLYTDIYFNYDIKNTSSYAPMYSLHERTPLHSYCPLSITISNDKFPQKNKYGIISYNSGRKSWIGGTYDNGKIDAKIRELGNFSVDIDTVAPVITELNRASWAKSRKISFKVTDNLSGIKSWTAFLDDKFILFELDAKKSLLFCTYDPKRMKAGSGKLKLSVLDGCGNESIYEQTINW